MKRKNTTTACQTCRKRRAKCDGHRPCCSRCKERILQCTYPEEGDGRRPASKSHVQLLRTRIELLERTLRAHAIEVNVPLADTIEAIPTPPQQHEPLDKLDMSGSVSRDAAMTFDQDGEARYFGLSSGRLEFKINAEFDKPHNPSSASIIDPPHAHTSRPSINTFHEEVVNGQVISIEIENELINDYFKWEQPHAQVVDETLFKDSRASGGKYFSPLLLNCILALASRYSLRPDVRTDPADPNTAGRFFLEKAEILLPLDLKSPSITTLQSFCILGNVYVATGSDAAGWLQLGMANRLALDMGMNLDSSSVTPSGWLSADEIELRKRIHWTLYCMDKTASMYTGRVCTLLDSQAQVCLPEILPAFESLETVPPRKLRRSILGNIQRAFISVSRIIEKILLALYSPKSSMCSRQLPSFLSATILDLKNWHYDLPKELRLSYDGKLQSEPSVYINHMVHQTAYILVMKPSLLKSRDESSRTISYRAALEICNIGKNYRKKFGSFRQCPLTATYCTLSAVLTLLNAGHHKWEEASVTSNNKHIEFGLSVLEELSFSWNPAKRIWQNLRRMYDPSGKAVSVGPDSQASLHQPLCSIACGSLGEESEKWSPGTTTSQTSPGALTTDTLAEGMAQFPSISEGNQTVSMQAFEDWPSDHALVDSCAIPGSSLFGALHNFSYMETNPVFQFDSFPDDYCSFDILNRIQVHNIE